MSTTPSTTHARSPFFLLVFRVLLGTCLVGMFGLVAPSLLFNFSSSIGLSTLDVPQFQAFLAMLFFSSFISCFVLTVADMRLTSFILALCLGAGGITSFSSLNNTNIFSQAALKIEEVAPSSPVALRIRQALSTPPLFAQNKAWLEETFLGERDQRPLVGLETLERTAPMVSLTSLPAATATVEKVRQTALLTRADRVALSRALLAHPEALAGMDVEQISRGLLAEN